MLSRWRWCGSSWHSREEVWRGLRKTSACAAGEAGRCGGGGRRTWVGRGPKKTDGSCSPGAAGVLGCRRAKRDADRGNEDVWAAMQEAGLK